jgi:transcriptional regulator GlxA family with amidase domain
VDYDLAKLSPLEIVVGAAEVNPKSPVVDQRIRVAVEFMKRSAFDRALQFKQIAARLNMSSSHLRHRFKKDVGVSPAHYVKCLRLQKARELLETTFLSVKEVMYSVGITDASHFVRDYKILFGESPSQTRISSSRNAKIA